MKKIRGIHSALSSIMLSERELSHRTVVYPAINHGDCSNIPLNKKKSPISFLGSLDETPCFKGGPQMGANYGTIQE